MDVYFFLIATCPVFFPMLSVPYVSEGEKGGGFPYHFESTWNPKTDVDIWEITQIFELLCFQDFFFVKASAN